MATKDLSGLTPAQRGYLVDPPVIAPGHTFKSVTEEISRIVLTPHTPLGWFAGFVLAGGIAGAQAGGLMAASASARLLSLVADLKSDAPNSKWRSVGDDVQN